MRLVKKCSNHLLAHLYEHIFYMQLDTELRDRGFFDIIDYSIDAYTEDGLVMFDIEPYAEINMDAVIGAATSDFLSISEFLGIGLAQVECEYGKSLVVHDAARLEQALAQLNEVEWGDSSVYDVEDTILATGDELKVLRHGLTFDYAGVDEHLRPLYRQIVGVTLNTVLSDIADTHGGFVDSEAYATNENHELAGEVLLKEKLERAAIDEMVADTVQELTEKGDYVRLLEALNNVEELENPPSSERTLEDTGIMMTADTWRDIATQENLGIVLGKLHFKVEYL